MAMLISNHVNQMSLCPDVKVMIPNDFGSLSSALELKQNVALEVVATATKCATHGAPCKGVLPLLGAQVSVLPERECPLKPHLVHGVECAPCTAVQVACPPRRQTALLKPGLCLVCGNCSELDYGITAIIPALCRAVQVLLGCSIHARHAS